MSEDGFLISGNVKSWAQLVLGRQQRREGRGKTFAERRLPAAKVHGMLYNGKVIHHMYLRLNLLIFYGIGFYFY